MTLWQMTKRYGFHFASLIAVVVFMVIGYSPMLSVFYSTLAHLRAELPAPLDGADLVRSASPGRTEPLQGLDFNASKLRARARRRLDRRAQRRDHLRLAPASSSASSR